MAARIKTSPAFNRNDMTAACANALLIYNPTDGTLRWRINRPPRGKAGALAGWQHSDGRWIVPINGVKFFAHRIIWLMVTGQWPDEIDHKDLNHSNNRWGNLRNATRSDNIRNRRTKIGISGYRGVYWSETSKKWGASITVNCKAIYLGVFATPEAAHLAYCEAARRYHGEFARFR